MSISRCTACGEVMTPPVEPSLQPQADNADLTCYSCQAKQTLEATDSNGTIDLRLFSKKRSEAGEIATPSENKGSSSYNIPVILPAASKSITQIAGTDDAEGKGPSVKRQFGGYEIIEEISRGSFGVVYKARQLGLDRLVALKVLLAGMYASAEAVARFQREAKAVAKLKHPNIVPVYEFGIHEGHHYFTMEFVAGQPLSAMISERRVSTSKALSLVEALADAISSAHNAGVIHRDIKPSNILIDKQGQPHITDFGLAKQVDLDTKYTLSGTTLGTPAYMPPEQARGEIEKIDARSDVYALGAVLYELLTGRTPFSGRSLLEVVVAVMSEPVPPPRQLNPKIHRDIQTIVLKCLEKVPRNRYASAAELRDDLRRFRSGETIRARPAGILRLTGRFLKRQSPLLGSIAVVLFVVGFSYWRVGISDKEKEAALKELEIQNLEKARKLAREQATWQPAWWFPGKTSAELQSHEPSMRDLYEKKQLEKEKDFHALIPGDKSQIPDYQEHESRGDNTIFIPGTTALVSPEDHRFYDDVLAEIVFELAEGPVDKPVRVGLQSTKLEGIPFLAEFRSGKVRVIGPVSVYDHIGDKTRKPLPLKLEIKAEKDTPELVPGRYKLNIKRVEMQLGFSLEGPDSIRINIDIKDLNLSSWIFENTQLVFRAPLPSGLKICSAEVRHKSREYYDEPAFREFFRDYKRAEGDLDRLAENIELSIDDFLKRSRALYVHGIIKEICEPASGREKRFYFDALTEVGETRSKLIERRDQVDKNLQEAQMKMPANSIKLEEAQRDQKVLQQQTRDLVQLEVELRLRKLIYFANNKRWVDINDELSSMELLELMQNDKLGEPLAWELQGALESVLALTKSKNPEDAGTPQDNATRKSRVFAALALFKHLGLPPGSGRLDRVAGVLADRLCSDERLEDLIALHLAYPSKSQNLAFIEFINAVLKNPTSVPDKSLQIDRLISCLVPFPIKNKDYQVLYDQVSLLGGKLVESGHFESIIALHKAIRGDKIETDNCLIDIFYKAILALGKLRGTDTDAQMIKMLDYCAAHVASADSKLQRAVIEVAKSKTPMDDTNDFKIIFALQQAYPTNELLRIADGVMVKLGKLTTCDDLVAFYGQLRIVFGAKAATHQLRLLAALNDVPPEPRATLMTSLWETVHEWFQKKKDDTGDQYWQLEYADLELALNGPEKAVGEYQKLLSLANIEPEIKTRGILRLAVLSDAYQFIPGIKGLLQELSTTDPLPDDLSMVLSLLNDKLQLVDFDNQLKSIKGPRTIGDNELNLLICIKMQRDGDTIGARKLLEQLKNTSSGSRDWVHSVASLILKHKERAASKAESTENESGSLPVGE